MIISVINNKGGTGKTATSVNLSAALAGKGFRVLLVDLDAQANASLSLGISYSELSPSISDVLFDERSIGSVIRKTEIPRLDLVSGDQELVNGDLILEEMSNREMTLKHSLAPVRGDYDFIICDCSPSISLLSVNALVAAEAFIVPMTPEYLSLEGVITTINTIKKVKGERQFNKKSIGILFTMVNPNRQSLRRRELILQSKIIRLVQEHYSESFFSSYIIRDVRFSETTACGKSIFEFAPKSRAALSYKRLAEEVPGRFQILKSEKFSGLKRGNRCLTG